MRTSPSTCCLLAAGKKAHLVIFERNPLDDERALLGAKTVIKDSRVCRVCLGTPSP